MKIHWFSPLPPERTDIADFTARVVPPLAQLTDLTLWTSQDSLTPGLESYCEIRQFKTEKLNWSELNNGLPIYNIGNNTQFHHQLWRVSHIHSGIVVLHDIRLHDFFLGVFRRNKGKYFKIMKSLYGPEAIESARSFLNGELPASFMSINYPLTELALENALGIVVHTEDAYQDLVEKKHWPVLHADLPFPSGEPVIHRDFQKGTYRIVVFGHIGVNRCLDSILEALSDKGIKNAFHLDLFGSIWDLRYAKEMIRRLDLQPNVTIHGFVEKEILDLGLSKADIAINLRNPTMGEASGSQLRIWAHCLPSIVSKTGWYSSLPVNTVAFVRPGYEKTDLIEHLQSFLKQPKKYKSLGLNGFKALKQFHDPAHYANQIVDFTSSLGTNQHTRLSGYLAKRSALELRRWFEPEAWIDRRSLSGITEAILSLTVKDKQSKNSSRADNPPGNKSKEMPAIR